MNVLAVGAHPDDLEILCGGTLARYAAEGHTVHMCNIASGNRGGYAEDSSEQLAATRLAEARRGAAVIGATHHTLGVPDGEIAAGDLAQRTAMVDVVRTARPDVVIAHHPTDYVSDHNEAFRIALDGSFLAAIPLFETEREAIERVPPLFHMDTVRGLDFTPTEYVDISETIETKLEMLRRHESQVVWLNRGGGNDVVESTRTLARMRGDQASVAYAEGFRPCLKWPRVTTRRWLP